MTATNKIAGIISKSIRLDNRTKNGPTLILDINLFKTGDQNYTQSQPEIDEASQRILRTITKAQTAHMERPQQTTLPNEIPKPIASNPSIHRTRSDSNNTIRQNAFRFAQNSPRMPLCEESPKRNQ